MTLKVGDKVLWFPDGTGSGTVVPIPPAVVGQTAITIFVAGSDVPLVLPLPTLEIGDLGFMIPQWNFDGWNFNFQPFPLLSLNWRLLLGFHDHDFKIVFSPGGTYYGDSSMTPGGGCLKIEDGPQQHGLVEFAFTDGSFENYPYPDDCSVCLGFGSSGIEIWVCAAPYPDYGASGVASVYIFDTLVWTGSLVPAIGHPGYIHYYNPAWLPS